MKKVFFLDMESIKKIDESTTSAWTQSVTNEGNYQLSLWQFSCSEQTSGIKETTKYDASGSVIASKILPSVSYQTSEPGTVSYMLLKICCSDDPRKQADPSFQFPLSDGVTPADVATEFFEYTKKHTPQTKAETL